jgi:hypothetical protein
VMAIEASLHDRVRLEAHRSIMNRNSDQFLARTKLLWLLTSNMFGCSTMALSNKAILLQQTILIIKSCKNYQELLRASTDLTFFRSGFTTTKRSTNPCWGEESGIYSRKCRTIERVADRGSNTCNYIQAIFNIKIQRLIHQNSISLSIEIQIWQ